MIPSDQREKIADRQQFVSDVFHALGQPLTELRCSLELALRKRLDRNGYRQSVEQALQATDRVIAAARFVRQLAEAEDPGNCGTPLDISSALQELIEEFEPVADAAKVALGWRLTPGLLVRADPVRLRRALFLLFDLLVHSAKPGTMLTVDATADDATVLIDLATHDQLLLWAEPSAMQQELQEALRPIQLAEAMIRAVAGSLTEHCDTASRVICVRLPVAHGTP